MKRESFDRFSFLIDLKEIKERNREISFLYNCVFSLHEKVAKHDISVDELATFFWTSYPDASHDLYDGLLTDLQSVNISEEVGETILQAIADRKLAISLSEASYELSQGRGSLAEIQRLVGALAKPTPEDDGIVADAVTTDLEVLAFNAVNKPGLRWRLDCLNKSLGSLRKGDFGFIFARPETGKTTFLASEASSMVDEAENPIIWFNNEEGGEKVMLRFYQGYFGVTLDVLLANVKQYKKLFQERVGGKFILVDNAGIDCRSIERIVHAIQPSLIIYDQIDKIKGFKADRDDLVYGAIYQWARELSKTYAPTIGVCQADGSAEGQKWLSMANVSNAKTSKQAEADWILGLGKTHEETAEYIRYINLSKNKLMGDKDSIPSLRHGRFEVLIQPEQARFKDIVKYG
jgi:hypothetical protein